MVIKETNVLVVVEKMATASPPNETTDHIFYNCLGQNDPSDLSPLQTGQQLFSDQDKGLVGKDHGHGRMKQGNGRET